jgi:hypothetical protein
LSVDAVATITMSVLDNVLYQENESYEGQHTGSMSIKSEGHMLKGEALSIDITPVAVSPVILGVGVVEGLDFGGDSEGQHSGLSSLHPTRGTSMTAPSCRPKPVY